MKKNDEITRVKLYKTHRGWVQCLTALIKLIKGTSTQEGKPELMVNRDALDDELYEVNDTLPALMSGMKAMAVILGTTTAFLASC